MPPLLCYQLTEIVIKDEDNTIQQFVKLPRLYACGRRIRFARMPWGAPGTTQVPHWQTNGGSAFFEFGTTVGVTIKYQEITCCVEALTLYRLLFCTEETPRIVQGIQAQVIACTT